MRWFQLPLCAVIICAFLYPVKTQKPAESTKLDLHAMSTGIGNFSLILMHHTAKGVKDNLITSPLTIWSLLAALAEGASGKSLDELLRHLRILKNDQKYTKVYYDALAKNLTVKTPTVSLEMNSALFADSSSHVEQFYVDILRKYYLTDVQSLDFKKSGPAAKQINSYVSNATHGRIKEVVFEKDLKNAKFIMTNAIYFKGQWKIPFNISETTEQPFFDSNGNETGKVNMMYGRAVYPYANIEELEARIIQLPYGEQERLSMLVILPYAGVSLEEMFKKFQTVPLTELFLKLEESLIEYEGDEVECWIPRFKISTDVSMVQPLRDMGIYEIFDPSYADLPKISKGNKVYVSEILHKAEIEVTEEGTTAAAVSVAELANRITASKFKANRPFVFLIVEKETNLFVFGGIYSNPSLF